MKPSRTENSSPSSSSSSTERKEEQICINCHRFGINPDTNARPRYTHIGICIDKKWGGVGKFPKREDFFLKTRERGQNWGFTLEAVKSVYFKEHFGRTLVKIAFLANVNQIFASLVHLAIKMVKILLILK